MRRRLALLALLIAAPVAAREAPPPDLGTIVLDRADPAVAGTLAGVPARLAVSFDTGLYVSAATAARLPLDWRKGEAENVGRVRIEHREAVGEAAIGGVIAPMLMQTQDAPCCDGHDGAISVEDIPWSTVRIGNGRGTAERRFAMVRDSQSGLSVPWRVGGHVIHIVLAPNVPETVATASAAAILADAYGGRLDNASRQVVVAYGVARTVRDMRFARPIDPLGFALDRIAVRIADYAGDTSLLAAQAPLPAAGAGEIEVRHKPLPPQERWPAITIGRDLLDRCPALAFYRYGADRGPEIGLLCGG
jgi:hypothetical protein